MIGLSKAPVDAAIGKIDHHLADIETQLDALATRVTQLQSQWDGEAREAFAEAMNEWKVEIVELHRIGAALNRVARTTVTRFDDFDHRRAGAWRR